MFRDAIPSLLTVDHHREVLYSLKLVFQDCKKLVASTSSPSIRIRFRRSTTLRILSIPTALVQPFLMSCNRSGRRSIMREFYSNFTNQRPSSNALGTCKPPSATPRKPSGSLESVSTDVAGAIKIVKHKVVNARALLRLKQSTSLQQGIKDVQTDRSTTAQRTIEDVRKSLELEPGVTLPDLRRPQPDPTNFGLISRFRMPSLVDPPKTASSRKTAHMSRYITSRNPAYHCYIAGQEFSQDIPQSNKRTRRLVPASQPRIPGVCL
jgi:hypothetical protein